jgi:hypothetical protein
MKMAAIAIAAIVFVTVGCQQPNQPANTAPPPPPVTVTGTVNLNATYTGMTIEVTIFANSTIAGDVTATLTAATTYAYSFPNITPGWYDIVASVDGNGDGQITQGVGDLLGYFGGTGTKPPQYLSADVVEGAANTFNFSVAMY